MEIGFDPIKRTRTRADRGLDVADAGKVFAGPVFEFEDKRFAYPERRYATIGLLDERMIVVIYIEAENGRDVIPMSKANDREQTRFDHRLA